MPDGNGLLADAGSITTIGLDGDDTLWDSESHFALTTKRFAVGSRFVPRAD